MKLIRLFAFLGISLILFSCSNNKLKLRDTNFSEEIDQYQNLIFSFNQELYPEKTSGWMSGEYLQFSPPVSGKYRWISSKELVFSPASGFEPSTEYSISFTKTLFQHNPSLKTNLAIEPLTVHTPWLKLESANTWWSRKNGRIVPVVDLTFNYDVEPGQVAQLATIESKKNKTNGFARSQALFKR
ncbi:MAG: hypothetical protein NZ108_07105, partial [Bacteroidia bacterium]|nr:hypothetical protein [Bacteroidia bacterium]